MKRPLTGAVLVAAILAGSPHVYAADVKRLGFEDIKGCWTRTFPDDRAGLDLRRNANGWAYVVLSANAETGEELLALVPSFRVCFGDTSQINFVATGGNEGRAASGRYNLDKAQIEFATNETFDVWPFASKVGVCSLALEGSSLVISSCRDGDGAADVEFGEQRYVRAVEYVDY